MLFSCTTVMSSYISLAFVTLCDVTYDVTEVLLGHQRFPSITSDQIEIESLEWRHCDGIELPTRLIWDLTPCSIHDLRGGGDLTLTSGSALTLTCAKEKSISFDAACGKDYDGALILTLRSFLAEL